MSGDGEFCIHCRHYPQSHEENGCRAGWAKDSKYQPKLPEGKYHCHCTLARYLSDVELRTIVNDAIDNDLSFRELDELIK